MISGLDVPIMSDTGVFALNISECIILIIFSMDFIHCNILFWNNKAWLNRVGGVSKYSNQFQPNIHYVFTLINIFVVIQASTKHTLCVQFNRYICCYPGFNQIYTLCVHFNRYICCYPGLQEGQITLCKMFLPDRFAEY